MSVLQTVSEAVERWCEPYELASYVVVPTYHAYPSNGCVQVFVNGGSDVFVVSDGGGAFQSAMSLGIGELHIEKHLKAAARDGDAFVNTSGWIIAIGATKKTLMSYISAVADCSLHAARLCAKQFKPEVTRINFKKEVEDELATLFPRKVEKRFKLIGESNKFHNFDFAIRSGHDSIVVIDAVTPDANSINSAIVSHLDVSRAHIENIRQRVVYDDRLEWKAADLSLLKVGATPVGFTHVASSMQRLVA